MKHIKLFENFSNSHQNDHGYYEEFAKELSILVNGNVTLDNAQFDDASRSFVFTLPSGAEMRIEHNWSDDGTSSKPVTVIEVYPDVEYKVGRFPIWEDPKMYAESVFEVIEEAL